MREMSRPNRDHALLLLPCQSDLCRQECLKLQQPNWKRDPVDRPICKILIEELCFESSFGSSSSPRRAEGRLEV